MTIQIKKHRISELKQGCGKEFILCEQDVTCGDDFEYKNKVKVILCSDCLDKIKQLSKEIGDSFTFENKKYNVIGDKAIEEIGGMK